MNRNLRQEEQKKEIEHELETMSRKGMHYGMTTEEVDCSLSLETGTVTGLIGGNGAGE